MKDGEVRSLKFLYSINYLAILNLDEWISNNFKGETSRYTLMKLLVPNADRTDCLKTLNRMNINHLTLFPDLYGASKYCNLYGEIDKY